MCMYMCNILMNETTMADCTIRCDTTGKAQTLGTCFYIYIYIYIHKIKYKITDGKIFCILLF